MSILEGNEEDFLIVADIVDSLKRIRILIEDIESRSELLYKNLYKKYTKSFNEEIVTK